MAVALLGNGWQAGTARPAQLGSDRQLLTAFFWESLANATVGITNVQYGGQAAILVDEIQVGTTTRAFLSLWRLGELGIASAASSAITYTLSHPEDPGRPIVVASAFYSLADQTTPEVGKAKNSLLSGSVISTAALTTVDGGMLVAVAVQGTTGAWQANNGLIKRLDVAEDASPTMQCTAADLATLGVAITPQFTFVPDISDSRSAMISLSLRAGEVPLSNSRTENLELMEQHKIDVILQPAVLG